MELLLEKIIIYGSAIFLCLLVIFFYLRGQRKQSKKVDEKIALAKSEGLYEPISLHPVIDPNSCIKTGACILACPEKDIIGIRNGRATTINASRCVGHGACFHACPTQAISLRIGTESRGVELPHVDQHFQSNVPGLYIAGELGGMGLIKNAVEQGRQAVDNIAKNLHQSRDKAADFDLIIVGAGPAGISGSLTAKKHKLNFLTLEQDTLGGTVFSFPRSKIVMTSTMELPLYGKVKLFETNKSQLLELWKDVLTKNEIIVKENTKVDSIIYEKDRFKISTLNGENFTSKNVLLSIGRRGSPRKLNIPGETLEKVAYRLLEPEHITDKNVVVVGGGDSAVEAALSLSGSNRVTLSYRKDAFQRIKPKNSEKIKNAMENGIIDVRFNTNLTKIEADRVLITDSTGEQEFTLENDLVYIFAGGELPSKFLEKAGVKISKKFGETVMKHS